MNHAMWFEWGYRQPQPERMAQRTRATASAAAVNNLLTSFRCIMEYLGILRCRLVYSGIGWYETVGGRIDAWLGCKS